MKLVKEHIVFEKFEEGSDPIHDMGIGLKEIIKDSYIKIQNFVSSCVKKYEYIDPEDREWVESSYTPFRKIIIFRNFFTIFYYRNVYREISTQTLLNKLEFSKKILKDVNILQYIEDELYKEDSDPYYLTSFPIQARLTETTFKIKDEYSKFFENKEIFID